MQEKWNDRWSVEPTLDGPTCICYPGPPSVGQPRLAHPLAATGKTNAFTFSPATYCGLAIAIILATISGCLVPILQTEDYKTPPVTLDGVSVPVHAYRVAIEAHTQWESQNGTAIKYLGRQETQEFSGIPVDSAAQVASKPEIPIPAQRTQGWRYGWGVWAPLIYYNYADISHRAEVRLYAPGYELIVIRLGQDVRGLKWKAASDLAGQAAALDGLFFIGKQPASQIVPQETVVSLAVGSASAKHREALQFGIAEYERVAALARASKSADAALLQRLEQRAGQLRELTCR